MNRGGSVLVVLLEAADVRNALKSWPEGTNLAVCLMQTGECQMYVHRQEEAETFTARLARHLKLPASDICFSPEVPGFPSRNLYFSEDRRVLALVADAPALVEEAVDYTTNYSFALEEGLDPAAFLHGIRPEETKEEAETAESDASTEDLVQTESVEPDPVETKPTGHALPSFLRKAPAAEPGPLFRSATEILAAEEPAGLCQLHAERNGWVVIEGSRTRGCEVRVSSPERIFLRDDCKMIAIRLEPAWPESGRLPGRILIYAKNLPKSLRAVLSGAVGEALLEADGEFLFLKMPTRPIVEPDPEPIATAKSESMQAEPAATQEEALAFWSSLGKSPMTRRPSVLAAGIASLLALVGVGSAVATGLQDQNASVNWELYRSDVQPD